MPDSAVEISEGAGTNIDTRTEDINGHHRQVVVLGDPSDNSGVAGVNASLGLKVNLGANISVSVVNLVQVALMSAASLPLPAGASTAANQTTLIGHVDGIEGLLTTIDTDTGIIAANASLISQQLGGVLAVDATGQGDVPITLDGEAITISGVVQTAIMSCASLPLPAGAATSANQTTIIGHVDGIETLLGTIDVDTSIISTNSAIIAANASLISQELIDGTLAVAGTVTAELSAVDNAVLDSIETAVEAIQAGQLPDGHNVTIDNPGDIGGGTQYTEGDTDASITGTAAMVEGGGNALAVLTQPLTDTQLRATAVPVSATDLDIRPLVNTDVVTAELSAVDNAVLDTIDAVLDTINAKLVTGTDIGDVTINNSTGAAAVNIQDGGNTITVDGTVAVTGVATESKQDEQITLLTSIDGSLATTLSISGEVDIGSSVLPTGASTLAEQQTQTTHLATIAGDTTAIETAVQIMDDWDNAASDGASVSGDVAHDTADAGEPVKIGLRAFSPDGTTPGTAVAENDRTNAKGDLDGRLLTNDEHPRWWSYHVDGSSALTDASVQADPGDGFQIVITDIIFSNGSTSAINMFLEEDSTKILGPIYLEAVNGRGFVWKGKKHVTASTAVTITTSAAVAHSVDILGYIQAV